MQKILFFILTLGWLFIHEQTYGQKIVDLCFCDISDMPNSLLTNTAGADAVAIGPGTLSDGEGLYNLQENNFDVALPDAIFADLDGFTLEVDFLMQEDFAWIFDSGYNRFRLGVKTNGPPETQGLRIFYFTEDDEGNITQIDSDFLPEAAVARGERAKIVFTYDNDEGIAQLYKNGELVWETPPDQLTPGQEFYMEAEDGFFRVGGAMNGEGSPTPSLYDFKAYKVGCPEIIPPVVTEAERCGPGTVMLQAEGADDGNYRWYDAQRELIAGAENATYQSPQLNASTTFYVSIFDEVCESELVEVSATVKDIPAPPEATDNSRCGPGEVILEAEGAEDGNYHWYDQNQELIEDEVGQQLLTPELTVTTSFFVAVVANGCESALTEVEAIVNEVPAAPAVQDGENCGPGSVTLQALDATDGYYRWYDADENLIEDENEASFTTSELTQSSTFYVSIVENGCEGEKAEVRAIIKNIPDSPVATGGVICAEGSITLEAEGIDEENYRWYDAQQNLIAGATEATYTTPDLTESTTYFVSIVANGCESEKTAVEAEVVPETTPPVIQDIAICSGESATLTAQGGTEGSYRWYDADSELIENASDASFTTPVLQTNTSYFVTIVSGQCESEPTEVQVTVSEIPEAPVVSEQERCGPGTLTLRASGAQGEDTYRWYDENENLIAGETAATLLTDELSETTTYYASIVREGCESEKIAVEAIVKTPPPAPVVQPVQRCGEGNFTLAVENKEDFTYQWYREDGITPIRGADEAEYVTARLSDSRVYFVSVFRNGCESEKTEVMARVLPVPQQPETQQQPICQPGTNTLKVTDPLPQLSYRWYAQPQGGSMLAENANGELQADIISDSTFYVSTFNEDCESPRTAFEVSLEELPDFDAGEDIYLMPGESAVLQPSNGQQDYRWYPAQGLDFPDRQNPQASPLTTTTYTVEVQTASGCSLQDEITVHVVNQFPIPNAFSPNGDGLNDTWEIPLAYKYPKMHLRIYNRWGELVYETVGYDQPWDGRMMDGQTVEGTYLYHIVFNDETKDRQGKVTIIK
ncbi:MAG: gliding motility-associated C-terminal domain-containing protein [Cyclobacteriaceae bacterium]